jgi:hypothetical protein
MHADFFTTEARRARRKASTLEPQISQIHADHVIASEARQSEPAAGNRFFTAGSLEQKEKGNPARDDSLETRKTRMNRKWEMRRSGAGLLGD